MGVLSKEDRDFWEENGYVVVHNAELGKKLLGLEEWE